MGSGCVQCSDGQLRSWRATVLQRLASTLIKHIWTS